MTPAFGDNPLEVISDALRRRDPCRASELAEHVLAAGGRHPLLYTARAMWLSEQGLHDRALADFRVAETMGSVNPALKNAIALCLMRMDRPADAAKEYECVLALMPDAAPIHCRRGLALELAGDLDEARLAHERAVALDPNFSEALARLAFLSARRAAWLEARVYADRALAIAPQPAARLALAMAAFDAESLDVAEQQAKAILADERAGSTDKRMAAGLLGDVCDRRDCCDDAIAFYTEANQIALKARSHTAGSTPMLETVERLRRYFEAMPPRSKTVTGGGDRHVFILGFLRSGTTLIQEILAARDDTVVLDEKDALADAATAFMSDIKGLDRLWAADEAVLERYRAAYWDRVKAFGAAPEGKVLIDKMPFATMRIPLIQRLFPQAAIVFAMRDPRDVVWSCFRQRFAMNATTAELLTLEGAARLYDETMRLAELYREKLSPKLFALRLEDLIENFDGCMRKLCDFSGLPWQESMRDFAGRSAGHAVTTPSSTQVVRGLNRQGIGRWKRYARHLEPVQPLLVRWVEQFGYTSQS